MEPIHLTLLIPTFNRKQQLLELLKSIELQGCVNQYKIIICDNHSNYNVNEAIISSFEGDFVKNIRVNSWSFNTGMSTNISVPLLLVETEWCWMLSDDDSLTDGALPYILSLIKKNPDVLAIKCSLKDYVYHKDCSVTSVPDFIDYYSDPQKSGEMMYLSMVYNLRNLHPYLPKITEYSYSHLSFLLPLLFGLKDGKIIKFSSFAAIDYRDDAGDNWAKVRALKVALGVRTLLDVDYGLDDKLTARLLKLLTRDIKVGFCTRAILQIESPYRRMVLWRSLYPMFSINSTWYNRYACFILFGVNQLCGLNFFDAATKFKFMCRRR